MSSHFVFGRPLKIFPVVARTIRESSVLVTRKIDMPTHCRDCMVSAARDGDLIWITVMAAEEGQTSTCLDVDTAKAFLAILQREIDKA